MVTYNENWIVEMVRTVDSRNAHRVLEQVGSAQCVFVSQHPRSSSRWTYLGGIKGLADSRDHCNGLVSRQRFVATTKEAP